NQPWESGRLVSKTQKSSNLDNNKKLEIAKEIIDCAIYNKIRLLQGIAKNRGVDFENEINEMNVARNTVADSRNNNELMGVEGHATKTYFGSLYKLIPEDFGFIKREKHPPKDPVNAMLSYGYTVLRSRVEYGLMLAGLNIYEGIIHSTYRDRVSLGFDLMEEFRQPIVDRMVLTTIVRGQVKIEDFDVKQDMCYMGEEIKRKYLDILYCRLEEEYVYENKKLQFMDIIFEQAKKLAKTISNNEKYHGFRWR
ncbi:MAG: CRISPR-associated endonuclease Cas1, partial [Thermoplasmatales archaeon]|nr:CRISPR-associated endonuclease Cas1 [Thermoplasmatales archaeon]